MTKHPYKDNLSVRIDKSLLERMRNVVYWKRMTVTAFVEEALSCQIGEYEREYGEKFPQRTREKI